MSKKGGRLQKYKIASDSNEPKDAITDRGPGSGTFPTLSRTPPISAQDMCSSIPIQLSLPLFPFPPTTRKTTSLPAHTSVRHVRRLAIRQRINHIAECRQRLVDRLGLLQYSALGAGLADLLRAGEVDQVELACDRQGEVIDIEYARNERERYDMRRGHMLRVKLGHKKREEEDG